MDMDAPAQLGAVLYDDSLDGDVFIARAAERLSAEGLRLAGVVQVNDLRPDGARCGMALRELHSGQELSISQTLGPQTGCKLDPAGLVQAAALVEQALRGHIDLVVLNKFGKQEGMGGGLRQVLGEALLAGVPVLLGVSRLNLEACKQFAGDVFTLLPADIDHVVDWCKARALVQGSN